MKPPIFKIEGFAHIEVGHFHCRSFADKNTARGKGYVIDHLVDQHSLDEGRQDNLPV